MNEGKNNHLQDYYALIVEHIGVGIHAIDAEGKTVIYNEKMKQIEGLQLDDIQDRSILELFNFEKDESTLLKVLESGQPLLNVKQTYWNRKGIQITTVNDSFPVYSGTTLIGAIEFARDVTTLENLLHQPFQQNKQLAVFNQLTAESDAMKTVIHTAKKVAKTNLPLLLIGEAGTGKDLLAQSIHSDLHGTSANFYTLHCQSSDEEAIQHLGEVLNVERPYTLFCERIDLLSIALQQKLLAVLEEHKKNKVQLIASIGEDPVGLISSGKLLKEIYYFFSSFTIHIPPLRKRKEDIIPFVVSYLLAKQNKFNSRLGNVTQEVKEIFLQYDWPGNVRELEFLLDEITSLATTETSISYNMLPLHFRIRNEEGKKNVTNAKDFIVHKNKELLSFDQYMKEAEIYYLKKSLKINNGNITHTAKALNMSRQSLQYRLKKYHLS